MSEVQYVVVAIITGLGGIALLMIKNWARTWETKLIAHDKKLENHGLQIATITANMEHIRVTGDETRDDVKELLRQLSGRNNRSSG